MTTLRRHLPVPAALAALALAACSSPYGSSSAAAPIPTTTTIQGASTPTRTKAAELRAGLTYLLVEHAYLLAATIANPTSPAPSQLAANGLDLSHALGDSYGQAFGTQFVGLWTARNADIETYAKARAAKDDAAATAASTQLTTDVATLATLIHDTNKFLPVHTVTSPATGIGDELTVDDQAFLAWVDAEASATPTALAKLVTAAETMPHTAEVLAAAAAKLDPTTYYGTATGTAANLRASLTTMLVEHLELGSLTFATIAAGQSAGPQALALSGNTVQLHNAFASVYDDNVAGQFTDLWTGQLDGYTAYAKAASAKDDQGAAAATGQLSSFAPSFGDFVARVTGGKLDAASVTTTMQSQIADVQHVVQGSALNSPDLFLRVRTAVAHGPVLAAALAEAIAEQMPARYLP